MRDGNRIKGAKKIAQLVALIAVAFVLLNLILGVLCREILLHSPFRLSRAAHDSVQTDVLVMGNSRGVNLIAGTSSEYPKVFNLAYNGLSIGPILAITQDFFRSGNKAGHIVIEVSGLLNADPHCEVKPYWSVLPILAQTTRPGCPRDATMQTYFPLTAYNGELFIRAFSYWIDPAAHDQAWTNDYRLTKAACANIPIETLTNMAKDARTADAGKTRQQIAQLKTWLSAHGYHAKISFVLAPFFPAAHGQTQIAAIRAAADAILGRGNYLDLSAALPARCDLFADVLHINRAGRAGIRTKVLSYVLRDGR